VFEDLVTIPKKAKQIVCKYCGSKDIETTESILSVIQPFFKQYRQFVRCYTCNCTYYINSTILNSQSKKSSGAKE